jgi:hypothetical protein
MTYLELRSKTGKVFSFGGGGRGRGNFSNKIIEIAK